MSRFGRDSGKISLIWSDSGLIGSYPGTTSWGHASCCIHALKVREATHLGPAHHRHGYEHKPL